MELFPPAIFHHANYQLPLVDSVDDERVYESLRRFLFYFEDLAHTAVADAWAYSSRDTFTYE